MKIITLQKLNRNQVSNINEIEEVIGSTVEHINITTIDLENGRYANIVTYLDSIRDIVSVSIQEIGMLTKEVFESVLYHVFDGEYGLSIISDESINRDDTKEMYEIYSKYREVINTLVLKTYKEGSTNDSYQTIERR